MLWVHRQITANGLHLMELAVLNGSYFFKRPDDTSPTIDDKTDNGPAGLYEQIYPCFVVDRCLGLNRKPQQIRLQVDGSKQHDAVASLPVEGISNEHNLAWRQLLVGLCFRGLVAVEAGVNGGARDVGSRC